MFTFIHYDGSLCFWYKTIHDSDWARTWFKKIIVSYTCRHSTSKLNICRPTELPESLFLHRMAPTDPSACLKLSLASATKNPICREKPPNPNNIFRKNQRWKETMLPLLFVAATPVSITPAYPLRLGSPKFLCHWADCDAALRKKN